jgi:nucleoside-diphosphate-sugar epimerase
LQETETFVDRILITGANGWLGKRLARLIARKEIGAGVLAHMPPNPSLRCLILPNENADDLRGIGAQAIGGDVRSARDCATFCDGAKDAVLIHTAGIIHPQRIKDFYDINVGGTQNILNAARAAGIKRVVFVSSNSPLGVNRSTTDVFNESSPYNPYMNYGRSKMQAELFLKKFEIEGGPQCVVVRPPWFYGPDQPPRQTLFFTMIKNGKAPIVGSGNNMRSMAFIDNLSEGLLLAAYVERAAGQIYWIADRRPYSMNEIIDTVERLLETEFHLKVAHKRMRLPNVASEVALLADNVFQSLGMYQQKIHVLSEMNKTIACSIAKAETELGYDPKVSLEEGMRRSLAFCVENGIPI